MRDYDKDSFLAGYRAAFALRGWGTFGLRCVRQALFEEPYTVEWHGANSFTVTWVAKENITQGVIMLPGVTPVTLTGYTNASGGQRGNFQWGLCHLDGFLPQVISTGEGRESYTNSIPNDQIVTIADPTNMSSVFCGDVYTTPGVELTLTVTWGGVEPGLRLITEDGDPLTTEAQPIGVTPFVGGEWYMFSQYASFRPDAAVVDTGFAARLQRVGGNTPDYFMWLDTESNSLLQVWWTDDPAYINSSSFYLYRLGEQYALESTGTGYNTAIRAGDLWYWYHVSYYRPDNAKTFTGTHLELQDYMADLSGRYLITE